MSHPNIVRLIRVLRIPNRLAMVMEYIKGGELFDYVQTMGRLPEPEVRIAMRQIFQAVKHIHCHGIVHRDLKLENILRDEDGRIYLSDFGFATEFGDRLLETSCGSPCYAAPELVLDKKVELIETLSLA